MIYNDSKITITKDYIRLKDSVTECIPIESITAVSVKREVIGDFKAGAYLFFVLGVLSIWFFIGFVFIALGIGAYFTKKYNYVLLVEIKGRVYRLLESENNLDSLCNTIKGLMLSINVCRQD